MHFGWIDYLGLFGAVLILFAFYRINIGKWTNHSLWYELDNLVGALALGYYALHKGAVMSMIVNFTWVVVALFGLRSIYERHPRLAKKKSRKRS